MKTLVFANQKGGVGKSAIAAQLAHYSAKRGLRVLFIDLDHQCNASKSLIHSGLTSVVTENTSAFLDQNSFAIPDGDFVVMGGDHGLKLIEKQPDKHGAFVNNLHQFIANQAQRFDLCIIDTNPNPEIRYGSALIVANFIVSPVQLNQEALDGISALINDPQYGLNNIQATLNPSLELIGILPNLVEPTPFQKSNFAQLAASFSHLLIKTGIDAKPFAFIPKRTAIAEAMAANKPLYDLPKTSARDAWQEIKPFFDVILSRMNLEPQC